MIKNLENISPTRKRLEVEISADVIEEKIQKSLGDIRKKANLPGFRPGKAPLSIIEKKYGSSVESEVLEKVVSESYGQVIREANLHPVTNPQFEKTDFKRKKPLSMIFTIEVMPEIDNLQYDGIAVKDEEIVVEEKEVEALLMRARAERVKYDVVDRPVEENDLVTVDYDIVEENIKREGQVIKVGSDQFPRELSDQLKGKTKGGTFDVKLTFPADHPSEFKGKTLTFRGEIKEVKVLSLPELDDSLAADLGYENLEAMKKALEEETVSMKKDHLKKKQMAQIIEQLVDKHEFPVPDTMLDAEIASLLTSEKAKEENKDRDEETLRKEIEPEAMKSAKAAILLSLIGDRENVTVSEEDMKTKVLEISQSTYIPPQNLIQMFMQRDGSLDGLRYTVFKEKVAELLFEKAVIEKGE